MEIIRAKEKTTSNSTIEGWEDVDLGSCFDFKNGLNKAKEYFGQGTPIVNYMDVYKNRGLRANDIIGKVLLSREEIKNYEVKKGDVFFTRTSETVEEIGMSSVILEDVTDTVFSGFVLRARPKNDKLDLNFKKYCFSNSELRKEITSKSSYTTRALTNGRLLSKVIIKIPRNKAEQTAIAQVLSDTDELISSLEKLIEKKKLIKQATMQQLLTGKKRLPGFSGKWEIKTILEITDCLDNLRIPLNESQRLEMKGEYPYCGANGILDYINRYVIDDDIILIAEDGGYFDEYAYRPIAYRIEGKCWVNNHAHILKAKKGFDQSFLFYSLVHKDIQSYISSGTRAKLNRSELNKIEIYMPVDEVEQNSIGEILNEMDSEIESHEQKLNKYKSIKQGMMQNLLTGKIRLV